MKGPHRRAETVLWIAPMSHDTQAWPWLLNHTRFWKKNSIFVLPLAAQQFKLSSWEDGQLCIRGKAMGYLAFSSSWLVASEADQGLSGKTGLVLPVSMDNNWCNSKRPWPWLQLENCYILAPSGQARIFSNHHLFCSLLLVQQLKGKILVKGKKLSRQEDPTGANGNNNLEAEDVSDEDEAAEIEDESVKTEIQQKGKVSKRSNWVQKRGSSGEAEKL